MERRICVFCGSSPGRLPSHGEAARALGRELAARGLTLVYGGGHRGLMGMLADAALDAGGSVVGVIPRSLVRHEDAHTGLARLELVDSLHARKARMAELADAFIALPGGFGTFEELLETIAWGQMGVHRKPVGLLDVDGYFAPFVALAEQVVRDGYALAPAPHFMRAADAAELLTALLAEVPATR